eukprot:6522249-Prymnesium_polylepis.1
MPEELSFLLERRRRETRARLLAREHARQWEQWRRWAWCRGSCGAAVLQVGARGIHAREAAQVGGAGRRGRGLDLRRGMGRRA